MAYGVNLSDRDISRIQNILGCEIGELPSTYLGLPLGANPRLVSTWDPVVSKIEKRLTTWKASTLSKAGKIVLIKAVLDSIPCYYLSLFRMPKKVINKINSIQSKFLWGNDSGKGLTLMKWKRIAKPKESGGLGITDIETKNAALLFKWWWKFSEEDQKLWKQVVCAVYNHDLHLPITDAEWERGAMTGVWKSIISITEWRSDLKETMTCNLRWVVKNGARVRFWLDLWTGSRTLKVAYPRLYSISNSKTSTISEMGVWNGQEWIWNFNWRRSLFEYERSDFGHLQQTLDSTNLLPGETEDRLAWLLTRDKRYSPKSFYCNAMQITASDLPTWHHAYWSNWAPPRVEVLVWFILHKRIATKDRLFENFMLTLGQLKCPLCACEVESIEHLFLNCRTTKRLWRMVFSWWGVSVQWRGAIEDSLEDWCSASPHGSAMKSWRSTYMFTLASIWHVRNKVVFEDMEINWHSTLDTIKLQVIEWCKKDNMQQGSISALMLFSPFKDLFI